MTVCFGSYKCGVSKKQSKRSKEWTFLISGESNDGQDIILFENIDEVNFA